MTGMKAKAGADKTKDEPQSDKRVVVANGQLGDEISMRSVLELVAGTDGVQHAVIRILSRDVRGHIGIHAGRLITGAHVTSTREYGKTALKKLLSATKGMYAVVSVP